MHARHNFVWLSAAGWQQALQQAGPACRVPLMRWASKDWPAIVRRRETAAGSDDACLGVALPPGPAGDKQRVPLIVSQSAISRWCPPPDTGAVAGMVPVRWREPFAALSREAAQQGLVFRVYGSLALQALTGQSYLTARSDIDLLLAPASREELVAGLDLLVRFAPHLPLDGEIMFPGGAAVAWKEWLSAGEGTRVLVKSEAAVALQARSRLLAALEDESCRLS